MGEAKRRGSFEQRRQRSLALSEGLFEGIKEGDIERIMRSIEAGADVHRCNKDGYPPLYMAVFEENIEACEVLIAAGADINALDSWGNTPENLAWFRGGKMAAYFDVVRNRNSALGERELLGEVVANSQPVSPSSPRSL